jgi:hypothetical protein
VPAGRIVARVNEVVDRGAGQVHVLRFIGHIGRLVRGPDTLPPWVSRCSHSRSFRFFCLP